MDNLSGTMHVGIPKPEFADGREDWQQSLNEMEALIVRAGRQDSVLIRNCLMRAEIERLSPRETMTLIAYHALRSYEDVWQRVSTLLDRQPLPPVAISRTHLRSEMIGEQMRIIKEAAEHIEAMCPRPGPYHPAFAALLELAGKIKFVPRGST